MTTQDPELRYLLALTRALFQNPAAQNLVLDTLGSAREVYDAREEIQDICPTLTPKNAHSIASLDTFLERADRELEFIAQHNIQALSRQDTHYPARLKEAENPPVLLFHLGNVDLNAPHILSIVGSRQCTEYGKSVCRRFIGELCQLCPDTLIVSGLAYGVDINAHRQALDHGMNTLGVLAHGMDQIYPRHHTETAKRMVKHGGLLTEYQSGSTADKINFVARNRIVAAMADATLVVESREKGGSLITARLANDAGRRVFAVPGRWGDETSMGCNRLIADEKGEILLSARQFVEAMGWHTQQERSRPVQRNLFVETTEKETAVLQLLANNADGLTLNELHNHTLQPIPELTARLFEMEMKGIVKLISGGRYVKL